MELLLRRYNIASIAFLSSNWFHSRAASKYLVSIALTIFGEKVSIFTYHSFLPPRSFITSFQSAEKSRDFIIKVRRMDGGERRIVRKNEDRLST